MIEKIKKFAEDFLSISEDKQIRIISHYDTDGITSAAIISKTLQRLDKKFSLRIVKGLDDGILNEEMKRNEKEILLFCDLGSGSLDYFKNLIQEIFIIDHHEIFKEKIPEKVKVFNPHLFQGEEICSAGLCYLFSKALSSENKNLAKLAVIGMIGDRHENLISRTYQQIIMDAGDLKIKKGLLIFSATRPVRRALEYSTSFYIPGITGSSTGVFELLRETGISPDKSLEELNEDEMSRLVTSILLKRSTQKNPEEIIGNIYLMKFYNRMDDVREISVLINACSRLGYTDTALLFCLEQPKAYAIAHEIYIKYRQELVSALKSAETLDKIKGHGFVIMNARDSIKDTIIGTVTSILSSSTNFEEGTVLIGMAYNQNKIKVSARIVGKGRNLKQVLETSASQFEAEVGGHQQAAGCMIKKEDEARFIENLRKNLEIEIIRV